MKYLLFPFAVIYGLIVSIRNLLFDAGVFPQEKFDIPIICIGNLAVGGTGKTPHVEYLIRLLKKDCKVAVLSRGYKRKTKGFVLADKLATAQTIGDEPFQIKTKFNDIIVAVDENRRRGINQLLETENPDIILLDDAYQHRYVKPRLSILLTDYHRLFSNDCMLPAGRLREPRWNKNRADIVIVTKCPLQISSEECQKIAKKLKLQPKQQLYFSTYLYDEMKAVFPEATQAKKLDEALLVTGIVSPKQLYEHINQSVENIVSLSYPDHYDFTIKDVNHILETFNNIKSQVKAIIITEKDKARLANMPLPEDIKKNLYSIGVCVAILQNKETEFQSNILQYVT